MKKKKDEITIRSSAAEYLTYVASYHFLFSSIIFCTSYKGKTVKLDEIFQFNCYFFLTWYQPQLTFCDKPFSTNGTITIFKVYWNSLSTRPHGVIH